MREHRLPDDGLKLELALDDVCVQVPWQGRSPRGLTGVNLKGIFKAQAKKSVSAFVDPDQTELDLSGKPRPQRTLGPFLLNHYPGG